MPLNQVQVQFVREAARPMINVLILFHSKLNAFVADYDNQQTPLATTAAVLDDNESGNGPRIDVPTIQGLQIQQLRNFCASMRDQITAVSLNSLIALSDRPLETIIRQQH